MLSQLLSVWEHFTALELLNCDKYFSETYNILFELIHASLNLQRYCAIQIVNDRLQYYDALIILIVVVKTWSEIS